MGELCEGSGRARGEVNDSASAMCRAFRVEDVQSPRGDPRPDHVRLRVGACTRVPVRVMGIEVSHDNERVGIDLKRAKGTPRVNGYVEIGM